MTTSQPARGRGISSAQIHVGHCLDVLRTLPDESVHCCVTSPPYWGLRDYGHADQLGSERTYLEYVANMVAVFREVRRVLRADGTLWLNLGDSYAGGGRGGNPVDSPFRKQSTNVGSLVAPSPIPAGLKSKDLVGVPWRVAFALQADGWYLRSDIIWSKPNPMPESVTDRPTKAHEYIFLLTRSERYFYDADAIAEPASYAMHAEVEQGYEGNGQKDYEGAGVQNPSDVKKRIIANAKRKSVERGGFNGKTNELPGREAFRAFTITRNKRTVWSVPSAPYRGAHFATFPPDLVKPCILAGSKPGDAILDPFAGSGTTGAVALELGRSAVLIELNPQYAELCRQRCNITPGLALETHTPSPKSAREGREG